MRRTRRGEEVQEEGVGVEGTRTMRVRASVCACASLTRRLRSAAARRRGAGRGGEPGRRAASRATRGVGGGTVGGGQAGSSMRLCAGPGQSQALCRAEPRRATPGRATPRRAALRHATATPGQASTSDSPTAGRVVISVARYFCAALACTPSLPSLFLAPLAALRSVLSLSARRTPPFISLPPAPSLSFARPLSVAPFRSLSPSLPSRASHSAWHRIAGTGNQHTSRPIAGC